MGYYQAISEFYTLAGKWKGMNWFSYRCRKMLWSAVDSYKKIAIQNKILSLLMLINRRKLLFFRRAPTIWSTCIIMNGWTTSPWWSTPPSESSRSGSTSITIVSLWKSFELKMSFLWTTTVRKYSKLYLHT